MVYVHNIVMGICAKCGEFKEVRQHHYKGYSSEETKPYCKSCDQKAHFKAKKEGRCKLSAKETKKLTQRSANKRFAKTEKRKQYLKNYRITNAEKIKTVHREYDKNNRFNYYLYDLIDTNIGLETTIRCNINTNTISIISFFRGRNGVKLRYINEC